MNKNVQRISMIFCLLPIFLWSCHSTRKNQTEMTTFTDKLEVNYATGFSIYYGDNYKQVIVNDPWKEGERYACYYLVESDTITTPADGIKIEIPLKSIASGSVTHYEFLSLLDELNTLTGVCQSELVYNPAIRHRVEEKEITDMGDAFQINIENVLMLLPSALMMSGYNQADPNLMRISQAGIPVIYNNEWMETDVLGRAEWIKFVSTFYNKEAQADSIFTAIEERYNTIRQAANAITDKPVIMSGNNFRGTWYMPSGNSYMGRLFADAGSDYYYYNDKTPGSVPLNIETVMVHFSKSDIWLNCNFNSMEELLQADQKHALFQPVQSGEVYNFNKRVLSSGANDFWESAVARPDLLLADIIAILHPQLLPGHEFVYASKLR